MNKIDLYTLYTTRIKKSCLSYMNELVHDLVQVTEQLMFIKMDWSQKSLKV